MPRLQPSVSVLIDILGYVELTQKAESDGRSNEFLNDLYGPLKTAKECLADENLELFGPQKDEFVLRAFTDNIFMGWPVQTSSISAFASKLRSALAKVSAFQLDMAIHGFFIRGAVSFGDVFIDDIAVFGPALIDAYLAERSLVDTPRVMLTARASRKVREHRKIYRRQQRHAFYDYLCIDNDRCYFVNYLAVGLSNPDLIARHRDSVMRKLKEFRANEKLLRKYQWVAHYHNSFCRKHDDQFGPEMQCPL